MSVATQHRPQKHCINHIIVLRNINILSHTITGTSLHLSSHAYHERISRPQHIMAQLADWNPMLHQWTATPPKNAVHAFPHANPADDATIHQALELYISSISSPSLDSTSAVSQETTTSFSPEDEEDIWLAMTFDDFNQGIPEDDKPPPSMDTEANNAGSKPVTGKTWPISRERRCQDRPVSGIILNTSRTRFPQGGSHRQDGWHDRILHGT